MLFFKKLDLYLQLKYFLVFSLNPAHIEKLFAVWHVPQPKKNQHVLHPDFCTVVDVCMLWCVYTWCSSMSDIWRLYFLSHHTENLISLISGEEWSLNNERTTTRKALFKLQAETEGNEQYHNVKPLFRWLIIWVDFAQLGSEAQTVNSNTRPVNVWLF